MIEFRNVCKSFYGNQVLRNVSFQVGNGEIMAVLGQNGAGKSTLMKILSGVYQRDGGDVLIDGSQVHFASAADSEKAGIGVVYQELSGLLERSVSENVVVGKEVVKKGFNGFFLDFKKQEKVVTEVFKSLGVEMDLKKRYGTLPTSLQQLVEIAKIVYRHPKIVVFDEPTTALTVSEREKLFKVMKKMRNDGLSIIFITHYLNDALNMCDKCVVLKDGEVSYYGTMKGLDESVIVSYMIGQRIDNYFSEIVSYKTDKVAVDLRGVGGGVIAPCDLKVYYGEVVGLAGLVGAGRTELMHLFIGATKRTDGEIFIDGKKVDVCNPADVFCLGIAYISEDRKLNALHLPRTIEYNIALPSVVGGRKDVVTKLGFVKRKIENRMALQMKDIMEIKCRNVKQSVQSLSGGNQQKVSIARWMVASPKIYIFDEPTKGIDVITKTKIFNLIRELAQKGAAVIMISSYVDELIGTCDRIEVMSHGHMVKSFGPGASMEEILLAE